MKKSVILERSLNKTRNADIPISSLYYLYSEMVMYAQKRSSGIQELEQKLILFLNNT